MAFQKNRKEFTRCAQSYRIFLKKFSENPSFDHESICTALGYVYDTMYKRKGPVPWDSKFRLANTILLNEQKILEDLETLTKFPNSVLASLASTTVSFHTVQKLVTEILNDCDDCTDEDLINRVCKQLRFSSGSENVKKIIRKLKENCVQQKKNNGQTTQLRSPIRKRKMSLRAKIQQIPNPIVLLQKDKRLQKMAKNFKILEREQEETISNKVSDDERCDQHCNGNLNDTDSSYEQYVAKSNTSQDRDLSQKDDLLSIKEEIDLIDNTLQPTYETAQTQNESTENQCRNDCSLQSKVNSQSSLNIESSSTLALTNDQESILAMRMANNNLDPSMQLINNARFIPNAPLMFNSCCNAYMIMPMFHFQPNIVMINSNGINGYYQGLFNNPMMQFNNTFVQNPMLAAQNFPIIPEQQLCFNQGSNPSQEIVQLQAMIECLNSQINSLVNNLDSQMHKNQ